MKATDHLLNDHKLIRKILTDFSVDNPRYPSLFKTLARAVIGHAWFEDKIFLPAFQKESILQKRFIHEISQEHEDLDNLFSLIKSTPTKNKKELEAYNLQMRTILETHLKKEEDALFPLTELVLDNEGMNKLGNDMEKRKTEIRDVVSEYR